MNPSIKKINQKIIKIGLVLLSATILALENNISAQMMSNNVFFQDPYSHQIIINEVAWAGTAANITHEWIELRNPNSFDIVLTGWKLKDTSLGFVIYLSGIIPGGGYYLIERDEIAISMPSDLLAPNLNLSDLGLTLELLNNSDLIVDLANSDGGSWPAGNTSGMVCSMERSLNAIGNEHDGSWFTNDGSTSIAQDANSSPICGSPKSNNSAPLLTSTPLSSNTPTLTVTPEFSPTPVPTRSVVINEVAWMGTIYSTTHEWIELYNPTNKEISISGWSLRSETYQFSIELSGNIEAGGYFLISLPQAFKNMSIVDQVATWNSLPNSGIPLFLYDPYFNVVDTANFDGGNWPAGDEIKACSMERGGPNKPDSFGNWLTSIGSSNSVRDLGDYLICGSPGSQNWAYGVTPTRTNTPTLTPMRTQTSTPTPTGYRPTSVIINEFLIQPREDHNLDGKIDQGDSYIEIINLGNSRVSLSGWRLDDQAFDSPPYNIENKWIEGNGGKAVFYSKDTGLLLSSGTDSVRLFKNDGGLNDVKTYMIDPTKGKSWCRYKDGYGEWKSGCLPSPGVENNFIEIRTESNEEIQQCDFRLLLDENNREKCNLFYQWRFSFTEALFGEPIVVDIGPYRILIK